MHLIKSLALVSLAALASASTTAAPAAPPAVPSAACAGPGGPPPACVHINDVETLVDAYLRILSNAKWDDADAKYLAESFVDTSDSINILAGIPLGNATFPTKAAIIEHEKTAPDNLPIKVTLKGPVNCEYISFVWSAIFGAGKLVRGLTILGVTKEAGWWQIKSIDVEFNSIAFLENIGGSCAPPTSG